MDNYSKWVGRSTDAGAGETDPQTRQAPFPHVQGPTHTRQYQGEQVDISQESAPGFKSAKQFGYGGGGGGPCEKR